MAFPVVGNFSVSSVSTADTSHTVGLPLNIVSGNLLIVNFGFAVTGQTITWPTGWTQFFFAEQTAGSTEGGAGAYRKADGTEGATITVTTSVSTKSSHGSFRITGHEDPVTQAPEAATAIGSNANADPPDETPTGGAKDYLWLAIGFNMGPTGYSGGPANYTLHGTGSSSGGANASNTKTGIASRALNAASENPGAFGGGDEGGTSEWVGATVVVHPAGAPADLFSVTVLSDGLEELAGEDLSFTWAVTPGDVVPEELPSGIRVLSDDLEETFEEDYSVAWANLADEGLTFVSLADEAEESIEVETGFWLAPLSEDAAAPEEALIGAYLLSDDQDEPFEIEVDFWLAPLAENAAAPEGALVGAYLLADDQEELFEEDTTFLLAPTVEVEHDLFSHVELSDFPEEFFDADDYTWTALDSGEMPSAIAYLAEEEAPEENLQDWVQLPFEPGEIANFELGELVIELEEGDYSFSFSLTEEPPTPSTEPIYFLLEDPLLFEADEIFDYGFTSSILTLAVAPHILTPTQATLDDSGERMAAPVAGTSLTLEDGSTKATIQ